MRDNLHARKFDGQDSMELGKKVASAIRWATSLTLVTQLALWFVTIFVIRLLEPADYGLMAMSMVFVSMAMIVNEFGLGSALVQHSEPTSDEIRAVHGLVLGLNFLLYVFFYISAPAIALLYGEDELVSILRVLALLFPISGFEITALALLERNFEFRKKSTIYMTANIAGVFTTLALALNSFGVWSLVYGNLLSAVLKAAAVNLACGMVIIPRWDGSLVRPYLKFGGFVAAERILWYLHRQADVFFIGKWLGKEQLGYYYVALTLASFLYDKTGGLLYEISLPTFSKLKENSQAVANAFLKALSILSFVVFPVMFGLAAVSEDMLRLLIGEEWSAAAPALLLLSLSMPVRIIGNLLPPALQGTGNPRLSLNNLSIAVVVMIPVLTWAATVDIVTVCLAWLCVYPVVLVVMYGYSRKPLGLTFSGAAKSVLPPLIGSALMFALVYWAVPSMGGRLLALEVRLAIGVAAGVVAYALFSLGLQRRHITEFLGLIRG